MINRIFRRKQKIVFMYADRYRFSGSTVMRGEQLCEIIKRFYGDRYKLLYQPLSSDYDNCVIFLTKGAVTDITLDQLAELTRRGNRVMLDPVDNPLDTQKAHAASCVIAASREAFEAYRAMGVPTFLVNHHVDIRIPRKPIEHSELRCGYFGELINTVKTDRIEQYVDFVYVDTGKQSNDWLSKPRQYNLHYAVRSNNVEAYKPFLKGFTAATCHANILIQRDQREALNWLGEDYPYLINPDPTEHEILEMIEYIKASYKTPVWDKALQRMEVIREATSDKAIAVEFNDAVEWLLEEN